MPDDPFLDLPSLNPSHVPSVFSLPTWPSPLVLCVVFPSPDNGFHGLLHVLANPFPRVPFPQYPSVSYSFPRWLLHAHSFHWLFPPPRALTPSLGQSFVWCSAVLSSVTVACFCLNNVVSGSASWLMGAMRVMQQLCMARYCSLK